MTNCLHNIYKYKYYYFSQIFYYEADLEYNKVNNAVKSR